MNISVDSAVEQKRIGSMVIRGRVIESELIEFDGRGTGGAKFLSPDPLKFVDQLPLAHPGDLADLYDLSFDDILDYLVELGGRLDLKTNPHWQTAYEMACLTAPTTNPIVAYYYRSAKKYLTREYLTAMAENTVGIKYLEGWVPTKLYDGRTARIRAFGARTLHIIAGNAPPIAVFSIARNALTRSDAIIKAPSNDPFTAMAVARTMCEMAPDHPLTKHLSVAYWKGGDQEFEKELYQPMNIEKIIAWGGFASVKHVTRYIQPGLELISLDPKNSISIIGKEAFKTDENMREAAERVAVDAFTTNQTGCGNSRRVFVQSGVDSDGLESLKKLGRYIYEAMLNLPERISTKPKYVNRELKKHIESTRMLKDWYEVIGGEEDEGAIVVSLLPEQVNFAMELENRTLNLIPVDDIEEIFPNCDAYVQTVGIYPEELKEEIKDKISLYGAQRIVSLGWAAWMDMSIPQDSIEPIRRSCRWIIDEVSLPEIVPSIWPEVE